MSHYTITLKGETYYIPTSHRTDIQNDIKDIDVKIENYKNLIKDLERDKKIKHLNLLDNRQLIMYENQYPKLLSSEKLKENKQYLRRESLLKAYDNRHGTYIQPTI